ncbi:hypothetical protein BCR42DRAFT_425431 [Absidia repens]|uniref:Uncharacterized protein n=1 Tax=Absidia repens TaxID=90262 RepID=A0A1X2I4E7_9FUNG|nr:hypothetical protein BCR42DRAFT_425431 [Absidia repens]
MILRLVLSLMMILADHHANCNKTGFLSYLPMNILLLLNMLTSYSKYLNAPTQLLLFIWCEEGLSNQDLGRPVLSELLMKSKIILQSNGTLLVNCVLTLLWSQQTTFST